jgi:hypothetical protein
MTGLWLAAIYPTFVIASQSFGVLNAVLLLDALFLWALMSLTRNLRESKPWAVAAIATGVAGGALTYFRSEAVAVVGLTLLLVYGYYRHSGSRTLKAIALSCLTIGLVMSPWIVRNYTQFHKVIIGSTSGKFNFWRGHNPLATGSSWNENGQPIWTTDTMWSEMLPGLPIDTLIEFRNADYHWVKAKQWIATHPTVEAERTLRKVVLFWGIDWYSKSARTWSYIAVYAATLVFLVLGVLRLRRTGKLQDKAVRDPVAVMLLWCVAYTLITMVFFSLPRIQILMIGIYFPIVVYGLDGVVRKYWKPRPRKRILLDPRVADLASTKKVFVN